MSEQGVIAIVGIVSGALVGIFAPMVSAASQARRSHRQWVRDQRVEVFVDVIVMLTERVSVFEDKLNGTELATSSADTWESVDAVSARMELFHDGIGGPFHASLHRALNELVRAAQAMARWHDGGDLEEARAAVKVLAQAQHDLASEARRTLGIDKL